MKQNIPEEFPLHTGALFPILKGKAIFSWVCAVSGGSGQPFLTLANLLFFPENAKCSLH